MLFNVMIVMCFVFFSPQASRDLWAYVAVAFGHLFVEMHHCPDVSSTLTEVIQACDALPTLNEAVSDVSVEILEDLAALGMGAQTPVMANGRGGDSKPVMPTIKTVHKDIGISGIMRGEFYARVSSSFFPFPPIFSSPWNFTHLR